jgi:hypothetical protein
MNDSMSILLATTILALGGLGLYMFKSSDENEKKGGTNEDYNEDGLFGKSSIFDWGKNDDDDQDNEYNEDEDENYEEEHYKPRKRGRKTLKNKKTNASSKRRY